MDDRCFAFWTDINIEGGKRARCLQENAWDITSWVYFSIPNHEENLLETDGRHHLIRERDIHHSPVVQYDVFRELYGKISIYAKILIEPKLLVAKKELSKRSNKLFILYVIEECDKLCMRDYGLACRHELLSHLKR